jgi:hypothetical protein
VRVVSGKLLGMELGKGSLIAGGKEEVENRKMEVVSMDQSFKKRKER